MVTKSAGSEFMLKKIIKDNAIYIVLLVMFAAAAFASPNFRAFSNISNLLNQSSVVGILAIGQTIVLITCGFDLSQGAFIALVSVIIALLVPINVFLAFFAAFAGMMALGFVNGIFINKGISPFVVTLGMQGVGRTLALWWSDEKSIKIAWSGIRILSYDTLFNIPICVYFWVVLSIVFALVLRHTRIGRHFYAIGGNAESARLSGINVEKVRYCAYLISAFCAFAAGMVYASKLTVGVPDKAIGYEMDSISCAIIGGTSLAGGAGTLKGTFAGVLIYSIITNFLNLMGVSAYWQKAIKGVIILAAVFFSTWTARKEAK